VALDGRPVGDRLVEVHADGIPTPTVLPSSGPIDGVVFVFGVTVVNVVEDFASWSSVFFAVAVTV